MSLYSHFALLWAVPVSYFLCYHWFLSPWIHMALVWEIKLNQNITKDDRYYIYYFYCWLFLNVSESSAGLWNYCRRSYELWATPKWKMCMSEEQSMCVCVCVFVCVLVLFEASFQRRQLKPSSNSYKTGALTLQARQRMGAGGVGKSWAHREFLFGWKNNQGSGEETRAGRKNEGEWSLSIFQDLPSGFSFWAVIGIMLSSS